MSEDHDDEVNEVIEEFDPQLYRRDAEESSSIADDELPLYFFSDAEDTAAPATGTASQSRSASQAEFSGPSASGPSTPLPSRPALISKGSPMVAPRNATESSEEWESANSENIEGAEATYKPSPLHLFPRPGGAVSQSMPNMNAQRAPLVPGGLPASPSLVMSGDSGRDLVHAVGDDGVKPELFTSPMLRRERETDFLNQILQRQQSAILDEQDSSASSTSTRSTRSPGSRRSSESLTENGYSNEHDNSHRPTSRFTGGTSSIWSAEEHGEDFEDEEEAEHIGIFQLDPEFDVSRDHLEKVFDELDVYDTGRLTYEQLYDGLARLWRSQLNFTESGLRSLIREFDTDQSKDLTKAEFVQFIQEFAARSSAAQGELREAFCVDYDVNDADCRMLSVEGGHDTIKIMDFLQEAPYPPQGSIRWIHLAGKNAGVVLRFANTYNLTSFEIEDCLNDTEIPKVNIYRRRIHILLNEVRSRWLKPDDETPGAQKITVSPLSIFLIDERVILTISRKLTRVSTDLLREIIPMGTKVRFNNARYFIDAVLDSVVSLMWETIRNIEQELQLIHNHVYFTDNPLSLEGVKELSVIQSNIDKVDGWFAPTLAVLSKVEEVLPVANGYKDDALLLSLESYSSIVSSQRAFLNTMEKWQRSISSTVMGEQQYRFNFVMYVLTVITVIFAPAGLLTKIYGMNFGRRNVNPVKSEQPEYRWKWSYLIFWIVTIIVTLFTYYLVRTRAFIGPRNVKKRKLD